MTTDAPRWIAYEPLDDLEGADVNPKNHDASIGTSLRRFGYVESITADERTGRLVSGHGRVDDLRAKRDAGEDPPDGVVVDGDGLWLVGVQHGWASANDGEAAAYVLASNQTSIAGGWDPEELASSLAALDEIAGTGFISSDLDRIIAEARQQLDAATDPAAEWARAGMPEFEQPSRRPFASVLVHFANAADAERFVTEVLDRDEPLNLGGGRLTRSVWWPKHDGLVGSDQTSAYVSAE